MTNKEIHAALDELRAIMLLQPNSIDGYKVGLAGIKMLIAALKAEEPDNG